AFLSETLDLVLQQLPTPRAKGLLALLIEEIRIVSPTDIRPVYRIPGEVRVPADTELAISLESGLKTAFLYSQPTAPPDAERSGRNS
ncbi:MAG TPA: hypothetical protein VKR80_01275, partial [Candidatus Limnocylindria bacterium]|nr:hypothetical protein [Candidatus Limnocylindria bacterium]